MFRVPLKYKLFIKFNIQPLNVTKLMFFTILCSSLYKQVKNATKHGVNVVKLLEVRNYSSGPANHQKGEQMFLTPMYHLQTKRQ